MGSSIEPLSSATGSATPAHPAVKVGINWLVVEDPRDIELTVDVCMQPLLRLTRIAQAATHKRTLTGVGIVGFYYLPEKTKIKVNVTYGESRHEFDVQTGARDPSLPCATSFIDPKTIMTPSIMFDGPEDILWSSGRLTYEFFKRILYFAMFILPHNCMCAIPNPTKRFCLELRGWKKGKKVRRYASQFRLGLSRDIRKSFAAVRRYHNTKHEGTWVEDELVNCFERLAGDEDNRGVKVYIVELREKTTNNLAACIVALASGTIFHDVTMATPIRDERSAGHILTKSLGYLLAQSGYTHWYWGFKNPYMDSYDGCNPLYLNRRDFWDLWHRDETVSLRLDFPVSWIECEASA